MYDCIVCDPGEKRFEGTNIGMLYTAISRATTLGDPDGLNSAIYFKGEDFRESRLRQLGKHVGTTIDYKNIARRKLWVQYLRTHTDASKLNDNTVLTLMDWFKETKISYKTLCDTITAYTTARAGLGTNNAPPENTRTNKRKRTTR